MTRRWLLAATCVAVLQATTLRASAAPPDPKAIKDAQERLEEGNRLYHKGDYDGARVAYEQSLALVPHGATYRNLGTTELRLGEPLAALKHLRMALADPELDAKRRVITKKDFDAAYAATGHVAVSTSPGASVTVDGNAVEGTAPFADGIDVTVGKHTLEARLGGQSAKVDVDPKPGQVLSVEIAIPPAPSATSAPAAEPSTPSSPGPVTAPLPETPMPQGSPAFWNARREIGVAVAGAGIVTLGLSAYFYADGNSQRDRASSLAAGLPSGACGGASPAAGCGAFQDAQNAQNTDRTLSGVFVGVGAAAVAAGAAMFFWPAQSSSQTAIMPQVSPHGGGLQLRQEF